MRDLFKTFRFSPDEAGGGTATAEPETVTMNDVTEDAIFAAAAAELDAAIANRDNPQSQPIKPAQPVLPDPNPPAEKPKAPETEAKAPAGLPSNLPDFMQELYGDEPPAPEAGWQPEGQPTQGAESAVQNATGQSIESLLATPGGRYRVIAALYDSGLPENIALARRLEGPAPEPSATQTTADATGTSEPDPLDVPEFDETAAREAIAAQVKESLSKRYLGPVEYDEDGNEYRESKFNPDRNSQHRAEMEREIANELRVARIEHENKRNAAIIAKMERDQKIKSQMAEEAEIRKAWEDAQRTVDAIAEGKVNIRINGKEINSAKLFSRGGEIVPELVDSFLLHRSNIERDFFASLDNPGYQSKYDIGRLKSSLPAASGQKARDVRVLANAFTKFAIEHHAERIRASLAKTAPPSANGTANGTKPWAQPPQWPSRMPGAASTATAGTQPAGTSPDNPVDGAAIADAAAQEVFAATGRPPTEAEMMDHLIAQANKVMGGN